MRYIACYSRRMSKTTIAVQAATRDALTAVCKQLGSTSMDEALRSLIWEHECMESLARLDADPEALADYRRETDLLGNAATEVIE